MKISKKEKITKMFDIHNIDSRLIGEYFTDPFVDVTITSPPYFDMKDYGFENQIGFGQNFDEYLIDIKKVFSNVYKITKDTGSLWIVIDTFKRGNKIIPLPFRVSDKLDEIGWKLHDVIIWNKDKTVPWSKKGKTKNKFEYILFLVKNSNKFNYFTDRIRKYDTKHLKKWWVRYPERYNPKGKSAEEIWNYPIPTQGSWGNGYIKHFCPLPTDLIGNIINLTTNEKDVVLDPFAGTGSVLVQAAYMNRRYIGFELNKEYIKRFRNYLKSTYDDGTKKYKLLQDSKYQLNNFENTILKLRALKYAKVFRNNLERKQRKQIKAIKVDILEEEPLTPYKLIKVNYDILIDTNNTLVNSEKDISNLKKQLSSYLSEKPLSKFGVEPVINYNFDKEIFISAIKNKQNYVYTSKNTHNFDRIFDGEIEDFSIISPINVKINEKDFE